MHFCEPCRYLERFKHIYLDGGLLPARVFRLQHAPSGQCLEYRGSKGTHPSGSSVVLAGPAGQEWPSCSPSSLPSCTATYFRDRVSLQ